MSVSVLLRRRLVAVLLSLPLIAAAQSTIVVTGARVPLSAQRIAADVVVIDAERIAASSADSIEELLRREAGLQLSRSGAPGQTAGVLIRGSNAGHALVLVDGVRVGSATAGLTEFEGISLAHVERIEVLRGPASSLYGADAVGGVIQIFTRRGDDELKLRASLGLGGYGAREATGSVSGGNGAIDVALSLADERLGGVSALRPGDLFGNHNPDRDGHRRQSASLRLGAHLSPYQRVSLQASSSRLNAQYDGSEFLPPAFAQDNRGDFRNRLALWSMALEHQARWSADWKTELRLSRQSSDLSAGAAAPERFRTDRQQQSAQLTWTPSGSQQLTLALDHLREQARSTTYASDADRVNDGLTLAWAGSFERWNVQADVRHDRNGQFGGVNTGRLGASLRLARDWRLRGVAGSSFRAVSFNDLYYPGYGVPTLAPERGQSLELGLEWRDAAAPETQAQATVYRNRVRDLVNYEPDRSFCPPGFAYDFGCARNIGRARLQGATLAGQTRQGAWTARANLEWLDARDQASGARLPRRAAHQQRVALEWRQGTLSLGGELVHLGARPEGGKTLAAATTVDLSARWTLRPGWVLALQLRNATDRDVEPARDYQSLGRQAFAVLRWESM